MEPDLLTIIYVTWDGKQKVGTGYPLDEHHILTARHLLYSGPEPGPARCRTERGIPSRRGSVCEFPRHGENAVEKLERF